jgi:hypothetical protein
MGPRKRNSDILKNVSNDFHSISAEYGDHIHN